MKMFVSLLWSSYIPTFAIAEKRNMFGNDGRTFVLSDMDCCQAAAQPPDARSSLCRETGNETLRTFPSQR